MSALRLTRAALLLAILAALLTTAPALAIGTRGHVQSAALSFGTPGAGAGQLNDPAGVAVDEHTGDVYVLDRGNNRIDRFDREGRFLEAWGWGVRTGAKEYQHCNGQSGCQAGQAGGGRGELREAGAIAIDNSTSPSDPSAGDLYVETVSASEATERPGRIEKFSAQGTFLGRVTREGERFEEELHGLTVGPDGRLWIYDEESVLIFNDALANQLEEKGEFAPEEITLPQRGVAVGSGGEVLLAQKPFGPGTPTLVGVFNSLGEVLTQGISADQSSGFATNAANGDIYVDTVNSVERYSAARAPIETLGAGLLSNGEGVAVNAASETVYVPEATAGHVAVFVPEPVGPPRVDDLNVTARTGSSATLTAAIDPVGSATAYAFRYSSAPVPPWTGAGAGPCTGSCHEVPAAPASAGLGFGDVAVSQPVTGLQPATTYHYRVAAHNYASGTLNLREYAAGERLFDTTAPVSVLADSRSWEMVSPSGKGNGVIQAIPREGGLIQAAPHGSGLAYISDGTIGGTAVEPEGSHAPGYTQLLARRAPAGWSSWDLDTRTNRAEGIVPGERSEYFRFSDDLTHSLLATTGTQRLEGLTLTGAASERTPYLRLDPIGAEGQSRCASSPTNEECFTPLVNPKNDPPVPAEIAGKPLPEGNAFGGTVRLAGSSADLKHVALDASVPLAPPYSLPTTGNVYEWSGESLKLASIMPDGTPAEGAVLGLRQQKNNMVDHAVSSDGSRLIFTTYGSGGGTTPIGLYMRDTVGERTIRLDAQQPGVEVPEAFKGHSSMPLYQTASADEKHIFFTDELPLTLDSQSQPGKPDLYVCDVTEAAGKLECSLHDLTARAAGGRPGDVQGVIGAGETGEAVYFVANGALGAGATSGQCTQTGFGQSKNAGPAAERAEEALPILARCDLYVARFEGGGWKVPEALALLSGEDQPDWLSNKPSVDDGRGPLNGLTSRVSPDGKLLAFMSDRNLTGYETRDAASGRADEEVYYYDGASKRVRCVSCNPTGEAPHGLHDRETTEEGIGPLVDRQLIWAHRWLSANVPGWTPYNSQASNYQSRYLSNNGRMFFDSAEELVPQDRNGKEDVYEYEPAGVGTCTTTSETYAPASEGCISLVSSGTSARESAFLDASEGGNDVFVLTAAPLAGSDLDEAFDVYDASVCGTPESHPCPVAPTSPEAPCSDVAGCRPGPPVSVPVFAAPAPSAPGPGEVSAQHQVLSSKTVKAPSPTRAQKLAAALRACHKIHAAKRRRTCETQAHRRYPAKSAQRRGKP